MCVASVLPRAYPAHSLRLCARLSFYESGGRGALFDDAGAVADF